ncbi:MAG: Biotin/lipoate A/B protein ligase [Peltula sp. TS41687]|nr:MAG: Biotin/lipoate A/B protein ligase [Peltula sp. TS41687]
MEATLVRSFRCCATEKGPSHWISHHRVKPAYRRYHATTHFSELAVRPSSKRQVYISRSLDPYRNLSIEHFLLQKTPPDSTILFLYVNRPCVVIGRNQNPWVEVNLPLLSTCNPKGLKDDGPTFTGPISLVRRRSGGGTVFHDQGNVNYCVICPTADFNRDKHAAMVATALQKLGVHDARVNERHDIVLDPGTHDRVVTSQSKIAQVGGQGIRKISGSAYKITRSRALHHGTCLLHSPNLELIPLVLKSPVKPYIKARGVESFRSRVGNVNVSPEAFQEAVLEEFGNLYGIKKDELVALLNDICLHDRNDWVGGFLDDNQTSIPEIQEGMKELIIRFALTVRHGKIISSTVSQVSDRANADTEVRAVQNTLLGRSFHKITDWRTLLVGSKAFRDDDKEMYAAATWLNSIFGQNEAQFEMKAQGGAQLHLDHLTEG